MGVARFVGQVRFVNQLMFPRELYPEINVSPDLTVYDAISKSMAEMITISIERRDKYGYQTEANLGSFPAGYTRSDLDVRFENFDQQWRRNGDNWVYQGGSIKLELTLAVYADQRAKNRARCWSLILEHEYLHVCDEIDLVMNHLPQTLNSSPIIRGYLQMPTPDREFNDTFRGRGSGEGSEFERRIQESIWIGESSRRSASVHQRRPNDGQAIRDCINAP